jgi:hypothetical protein
MKLKLLALGVLIASSTFAAAPKAISHWARVWAW